MLGSWRLVVIPLTRKFWVEVINSVWCYELVVPLFLNYQPLWAQQRWGQWPFPSPTWVLHIQQCCSCTRTPSDLKLDASAERVDKDTSNSWAILCLWSVKVHGPQLVCTQTTCCASTIVTIVASTTATIDTMYCTCFITISWARKESQLCVW